jgi:hypothetical protein
MIRLFNFIFALVPFFCHAELQNKVWQVKDVGSLTIFDWAESLELNDSGQVLFRTKIIQTNKDVWAVGQIDSSATILPTLPKHYPQYQHATEVNWQRINKSGMVIGDRTYFRPTNTSSVVQCIPELITWSPTAGIKQYTISSVTYQNRNPVMKIAQCYNSEHVVFTLEDRIFILKAEKPIDLSPILLKEIQKFGINYYEIKWKAIAVNNYGFIYGKFEYFEKHPFKEKSIFTGEKYFLWNGNDIILIEIPEQSIADLSDHLRHLNNNNTILFKLNQNVSKSFIWDRNTGLSEAFFYNNSQNNYGHAIAVLDDGTTIFSLGGGSIYLLQDECEDCQLKFSDNSSKNIDFSQYPSLIGKNHDLVLINNSKQILIKCKYFGEEHPFLLNPK